MSIKFKSHTFKTGNRHGIPSVPAPREFSRVANFNDVIGEGQVSAQMGGRPIMVDAIIVDLTFTDGKKLYDYLDKTVKPLINASEGELIISAKDGTSYKYKDCVFKAWEPITQDGQKHPCPLPDLISYTNESLNDRVGPGAFWMEVVLHFYQLIVR